MYYSYNGTKIYYKFYHKKNKRPIVLLHGWGSNSEVFKEIINKFPQKSFLVIDFPPFGKSSLLSHDYTIFTYAQMLMSLFEHLRLVEVNLVGHSFGGRISIILSAISCKYVHSCILIDSAGLKPKRSIKYYYKIYKYKVCKKLGLSTLNMGSKDYLSLSPEMQKTFKNVVNTFLDDYLCRIKCKTLIIWGTKDKETPVFMAKKLNKKIKNSKLVLIKNAGHFAFLDAPYQCVRLMQNFWEE